MMNLIPLHTDWECEYLEIEPDLYEFMRPLAVDALQRWSFDRRRVEGWAAYLYRSFEVEPFAPDDCHYLYLDSAPSPARIYINDRLVGHYHTPGDDDPPFELDISAYVQPGPNRIGLRVEGTSAGTFAGLWLHRLAVEPR